MVVGLIVTLPSRAGQRLEEAFGVLFTPFFEVAAAAENLQQEAKERLVPRSVLEGRLHSLRQKNQRLQLRAQRLETLQRENAQLRKMLGFKKRTEWRLKPARVVGRDPANWWRSLRINLGREDGIKTNLPVRTVDGLVGRISEVGVSQSQVVLLGDPKCRVAGLVKSTRESGVVTPRANVVIDPLEVDFKFLPSNAKMEIGDRVVTSGQGGLFPKGLPIGEVIDTQSVDYGLYTEARVKLTVNFNRLQTVWVMLDERS